MAGIKAGWQGQPWHIPKWLLLSCGKTDLALPSQPASSVMKGGKTLRRGEGIAPACQWQGRKQKQESWPLSPCCCAHPQLLLVKVSTLKDHFRLESPNRKAGGVPRACTASNPHCAGEKTENHREGSRSQASQKAQPARFPNTRRILRSSARH